jgi:hypothetical protein
LKLSYTFLSFHHFYWALVHASTFSQTKKFLNIGDFVAPFQLEEQYINAHNHTLKFSFLFQPFPSTKFLFLFQPFPSTKFLFLFNHFLQQSSLFLFNHFLQQSSCSYFNHLLQQSSHSYSTIPFNIHQSKISTMPKATSTTTCMGFMKVRAIHQTLTRGKKNKENEINHISKLSPSDNVKR